MTKVKLKKLSFWGITKTVDSSWNWRNLLKLRNIARPLFEYKLGDGKQFSFWYDPWCNGYALIDLFPGISFNEPYISRDSVVGDFWIQGRWLLPARWNGTMVSIERFLTDHFSVNVNQVDSIICRVDKHGKFNTGCALRMLRQPQLRVNWAKLVWSASNMPRHAFIFWLAVHDRLRTKKKLHQWGIANSDSCVFCNAEREEVDHLFFECCFSKEIWRRVLRAVNVRREPFVWKREVSWFSRKACRKTLLANVRRAAMAASVYTIWRARNVSIFQQKSITADEVFGQIREIIIFKFNDQLLGDGRNEKALLSNWFNC